MLTFKTATLQTWPICVDVFGLKLGSKNNPTIPYLSTFVYTTMLSFPQWHTEAAKTAWRSDITVIESLSY